MFSVGHHRILGTLARFGPMSRTDLARRLDLSKASISLFVRELLERGVLCEQELIFGKGRPSVALDLRSDAASFVGISLHADPVTIVLTDSHRHVLAQESFPRETDPDTCFRLIAEAVAELKARVGDEAGEIAGIGVAQPGFVSRDRRVCLASAALGWVNVDVASRLSERAGRVVFVENDANALLLGDQIFGRSGGYPDSSLVFMGEGIGSAHIVSGRLLRGHHGGAGEISHAPILIDGGAVLPCHCGNRGCLETVSSLQAIRSAARQAGLPVEIGELGALAASGQPDALAILHHAGTVLGFSLAQLVQTLDPDRLVVILHPALMENVFALVLRQAMETHVMRHTGAKTELILREAEDSDFAIGAASVAAQHYLCGSDWI